MCAQPKNALVVDGALPRGAFLESIFDGIEDRQARTEHIDVAVHPTSDLIKLATDRIRIVIQTEYIGRLCRLGELVAAHD